VNPSCGKELRVGDMAYSVKGNGGNSTGYLCQNCGDKPVLVYQIRKFTGGSEATVQGQKLCQCRCGCKHPVEHWEEETRCDYCREWHDELPLDEEEE